MVTQRFATVPEYIASFPPATRTKLKQVRKAIRDAVPDATESISYHMPTYTLGAWKLYFSGYKDHISLHGNVEAARAKLGDAMAQYEASGRGTLKLPLNEPIPAKLIGAIARAGLDAKRTPAKRTTAKRTTAKRTTAKGTTGEGTRAGGTSARRGRSRVPRP